MVMTFARGGRSVDAGDLIDRWFDDTGGSRRRYLSRPLMLARIVPDRNEARGGRA
jgi:hypothetical protein